MTDPVAAAVTGALHDWALMYPIPAWGLAQGELAERLAANWARVASGMVMEAIAAVPAPRDPKMLRLLGRFAELTRCTFDNGGGCQAHGYLSLEPGEQCPHAEAKALLEAEGAAR